MASSYMDDAGSQIAAFRVAFSDWRDIVRKESCVFGCEQLDASGFSSIDMFEHVKFIGTGAFGTVRLVREKVTGRIYAMKQVRKSVLDSKTRSRMLLEKFAMSCASNSDWVVSLSYSFHDESFLYFVMEYLPGGDLMTHLIRKDTFSESETRFYIAELVEAIDRVHKMGFIHRDIKPDNILFDANGHIKLLDFGLCQVIPKEPDGRRFSFHGQPQDTVIDRMNSIGESNFPMTYTHPGHGHLMSVVGTPDYMAPEVHSSEGYNELVDWWAVGIIMFEMLFGGPPFSDEKHDPQITTRRVKNFQKYLQFPLNALTENPTAVDLIQNLLCHQHRRFSGREIRAHPFMRGVDFENIRSLRAPIVPVVESDTDTRNFDEPGNVVTKDENAFSFQRPSLSGNQKPVRRNLRDLVTYANFSYSAHPPPQRPSSLEIPSRQLGDFLLRHTTLRQPQIHWGVKAGHTRQSSVEMKAPIFQPPIFSSDPFLPAATPLQLFHNVSTLPEPQRVTIESNAVPDVFQRILSPSPTNQYQRRASLVGGQETSNVGKQSTSLLVNLLPLSSPRLMASPAPSPLLLEQSQFRLLPGIIASPSPPPKLNVRPQIQPQYFSGIPPYK